jgi:hypothetical protein
MEVWEKLPWSISAFESGFTGHIQERGQKVKRLKIAEIWAEIKPRVLSVKREEKDKKEYI